MSSPTPTKPARARTHAVAGDLLRRPFAPVRPSGPITSASSSSPAASRASVALESESALEHPQLLRSVHGHRFMVPYSMGACWLCTAAV